MAAFSYAEPYPWRLESLAAVKYYANKGVPVIPVNPLTRVPQVKWRKNPWIVENMRNPIVVRNWWLQWPNAMIGMPTGSASGWDVVDVDIKRVDGLHNFRRIFGFDPFEYYEIKLIVRTPSGGWHFYFQNDPNNPVGNGTARCWWKDNSKLFLDKENRNGVWFCCLIKAKTQT